MFEVSDGEDQAFWEALPLETLEAGTSNVSTSPVSHSARKDYNGQVVGNQQHVITTPSVKDDQTKTRRKTLKRKFPGPAGNLPPNMTKETLSPEFVRSSPSLGPLEKPHDEEEEEPTASQATLEEAFTSKQWKRLLSDLGPSASSVLSKFNIKSMLIKANKRQLPRGKIPLILGYIERVDFQGTDGSIVLRDPSGKMNGSIHQELIKDPSTALQVGWVLVLRQVSVISPMRNHYLNITSGNIVAIYRQSKENEVVITLSPSSLGLSPSLCSPSESRSNSSANSLPWDKLIRESEKELSAPRTQGIPDPTEASGPMLRIGQQRSIRGTPVTPKPVVSGRIQSPSSLFSGNTAPQRNCNLQPYNSNKTPGNYTNSADPFQQSVGDGYGFDDDFPDDDSDILSFCDTNAFDEQCISAISNNVNTTTGHCDSKPAALVNNSVISEMPLLPLRSEASHNSFSTSHHSPHLYTSPSKTSAYPTNDSASNFESSKKKAFSFKLTSSISSPVISSPFQSRSKQETTRNSLDPQVDNNRRPSIVGESEKNFNVKANVGRDFKVQLGSNAHATTTGSKENQEHTNSDLFGQWNDDLSDELLSQLSEEF